MPASQEAQMRSPGIQRPKNTAFGPWRSISALPFSNASRRRCWVRPGRVMRRRPKRAPMR